MSLKCDILIEYYDVKTKRISSRKVLQDAKIIARKSQPSKSLSYELHVTNDTNKIYFISSNLSIANKTEEKRLIAIKVPEFVCTIYCLDLLDLIEAKNFIEFLERNESNQENQNCNIKESREIDKKSMQVTPQKDQQKNSRDCISLNKSSPIILSPFSKKSPGKQKQKESSNCFGFISKSKSTTPKKSGYTPLKKKVNKISENNSKDLFSFDNKNTHPSIEVNLNFEQKEVIKSCLEGFNIFITGGAGTGKTVLLTEIIKELSSKYGKEKVFVTATTGLAAFNVGGVTIHQFSGLVQFEGKGEEMKKEILKYPSLIKRWQQAKVLIIDEISMLSKQSLETLNNIAKAARANSLPMGGIQSILSGDFLQLPPVSRFLFDSDNNNHDNNSLVSDKKFCFQSSEWNKIVQKTFILRSVFRQKEMKFVDILESLRKGEVTKEVISFFESCVNKKIDVTDGILPTQIFTHRRDVSKLNEEELSKLPGKIYSFESEDSGESNHLKLLQTNCPAQKCLNLKVGAQVILLRSISPLEGLVNGSRGVITRFTPESNRPVIKFCDGVERTIGKFQFTQTIGDKVVAQRLQYPIALSWGISVHKSQGMTVEKAVVNLKKVFEFGQAYVALSRVRSTEGLSLSVPISESKIKAHPDVVEFYESIEANYKDLTL